MAKLILSNKPARLSEDKIQRLLDFCEQYLGDLPYVYVVGRDGERLTLSLRALMTRDPAYGCTPLRPDWSALDVAYVIAAKAFNECWGVPEKQMVLLTQMDTPDLAALFVSRMLRRLYLDSTDPRFRAHGIYRAVEPNLVLVLSEAYKARARVDDRLLSFSKHMLNSTVRTRNPKERKQLERLRKQYRTFL